MPKATVVRITNHEKRTGIGKTGQPWTIKELEVEKEDGSIVKADTFETVADGDIGEIESNSYTGKDGKEYHSWTFKLPRKTSFGAKPAQSEDVLFAVRMVYRAVQEVNDKLDTLMAVESEVPPAVKIAASEPIDDNETNNEPLPEEPGDIEEFMKGTN